MKPRATGTALKRLDALEKAGRGRRTVALWPKMMDADSWSAVAIPSQARLVAEARDLDHGEQVVSVGRDPSDVSDRYRSSTPYQVDTMPLEAKVQHERQRAAAEQVIR